MSRFNERSWSHGVIALGLLLAALFLSVLVGINVANVDAQGVFNDIRHEVTLRNDPQSFTCTIVNNSATILTALAGSCAVATNTPLAAGQSLYVTDVTASASVIASVSADNYLSLKAGTGTACGTGTAVVWSAYNLAFEPIYVSLYTPIKVGSATDLCWMDAAVGSKTFIVTGYIK